MDLLLTILKYMSAAFLGGFFLSILCAAFAVLAGFDITDWALGGAFIGMIFGMETIRESRKQKPLWRQYMDNYEK